LEAGPGSYFAWDEHGQSNEVRHNGSGDTRKSEAIDVALRPPQRTRAALEREPNPIPLGATKAAAGQFVSSPS